ncbi:MAG: rhodanese-like domain-containing protein [Lachnospiraceae bacterium]|nr:rhodanese-like domain-containing protein [Lachnospiraceae bacterium]
MKSFKKIMSLPVLLLMALGFAACGKNESTKVANTYEQITQERAAEMMKVDDGHLIVDVRRYDEYEAGHIPGAICVPNESIATEQPAELPDKDQILLVYCRSGRRSKEAAKKLADMGYTKVYEFGGVITWSGELVK